MTLSRVFSLPVILICRIRIISPSLMVKMMAAVLVWLFGVTLGHHFREGVALGCHTIRQPRDLVSDLRPLKDLSVLDFRAFPESASSKTVFPRKPTSETVTALPPQW